MSLWYFALQVFFCIHFLGVDSQSPASFQQTATTQEPTDGLSVSNTQATTSEARESTESVNCQISESNSSQANESFPGGDFHLCKSNQSTKRVDETVGMVTIEGLGGTSSSPWEGQTENNFTAKYIQNVSSDDERTQPSVSRANNESAFVSFSTGRSEMSTQNTSRGEMTTFEQGVNTEKDKSYRETTTASSVAKTSSSSAAATTTAASYWDISTIDYVRYHFLVRCVLLPPVVLVGTAGNVLSCAMLARLGLDKSSNILLFALAVADLALLIGDLNPFSLLLHFGPRSYPQGATAWEYSHDTAYAMFIMYHIVRCFGKFGTGASCSLPVLISLERFIATFFPLKFRQIVTVKRAWISVSGVFLIWTVWAIFNVFFYDFQYVYSLNFKVFFGRVIFSQFAIDHLELIRVLNHQVTNNLTGSVPLSAVTVMCFAIWLRLFLVQSWRKRVAGSAQRGSSSKTTLTLLVVCLVFLLTRGPALILPYAMGWIESTSKAGTVGTQRRFDTLLVNSMPLLRCLNSAANFFIYVLLNDNFLAVFKTMFPRCFLKDNKAGK